MPSSSARRSDIQLLHTGFADHHEFVARDPPNEGFDPIALSELEDRAQVTGVEIEPTTCGLEGRKLAPVSAAGRWHHGCHRDPA